jgi:DNA-directed RNA polymerase specialized sigma24 family protein
MADEEDVALSAFNSFCAGVQKGRFPQLEDRDDLWKILVSITIRKAIKVIRDSNRQKRGGQWKQITGDSDYDILQQIACPESTPDMAAQLAEQFQELISQLEATELIELATLKMEGFTNAEIASRWGRAERTIERKLALVRQIWKKNDTSC